MLDQNALTHAHLQREVARLHAENERLTAQLAYHRRIFTELQSSLTAARIVLDQPPAEGPLARLMRENQRLQRQLKISRLSNRELEVLQLIAKGLTSKDIAAHLTISKFTVDTHRKNLLQKLDVRTTSELVRLVE